WGEDAGVTAQKVIHPCQPVHYEHRGSLASRLVDRHEVEPELTLDHHAAVITGKPRPPRSRFLGSAGKAAKSGKVTVSVHCNERPDDAGLRTGEISEVREIDAGGDGGNRPFAERLQ